MDGGAEKAGIERRRHTHLVWRDGEPLGFAEREELILGHTVPAATAAA